MKNILHTFREIYDENLLLNKRWLFIEAAAVPDVVEKEAETVDVSKEETPKAEPLAQSWADHQAKFDTHIAALPKDHAKTEEFKTEMDRLKAEYDSAIPQLPEAHAAEAIAPAVNALLAKIKTHLPEGADTSVKTSEEEGDVESAETEKKPSISIEDLFQLEGDDADVLNKALSNFVIEKYEEFVASFNLNEEKTKQLTDLEGPLQAFAEEVKDMKPLFMYEENEINEYFKSKEDLFKKHEATISKFQSIIGKPTDLRQVIDGAFDHALTNSEEGSEERGKIEGVRGKIEGNAEAREKAESGEILSEELHPKALKVITETFRITDKGIKKKVGEILETMKFTKEQITELGKETPTLTLNPNQIRQVISGATETGLDRPSKAEHEVVQSLTKGSKVETYFDKIDDPAFVYLSQRFKISKPKEGGGIQLEGKKGEGKVNETITDVKGLLAYLPDDIATGLNKIHEPKDGETAPTEEEMKTMMEGLSVQNQSAEAMMDLREMMIKITEGDEAGEPGFMEAIAMLMQFFQAIKTAFETGDWETLGDFLNDWTETKNPRELAKRHQDSVEAYKKSMENPNPKPTLSQLVKGYLKPGDADDLFPTPPGEKKPGVKHPLEKYRAEAKPFIKDYLKTELGLSSIADITESESGIIEIRAYNESGNQLSIELNLSDDGPAKGRIIEHIKTKKEGEDESWSKPKSEAILENTSIADLKAQITGEAPVASEQQPAKPKGKKDGNESDTETSESPKEKLDKAKGLIKSKLEGMDTKGVWEIAQMVMKMPGNSGPKYMAEFRAFAKENGGENAVKGDKETMKTFRIKYIVSKINDSNISELNSKLQIKDSTEAPKSALYQTGDTPPKAKEVLAAIEADGKMDEFKAAYGVAAKAKVFNAAKWQLQWMIENKIPKLTETATEPKPQPEVVKPEPKPQPEVVKPEPKPQPEVATEPQVKPEATVYTTAQAVAEAEVEEPTLVSNTVEMPAEVTEALSSGTLKLPKNANQATVTSLLKGLDISTESLVALGNQPKRGGEWFEVKTNAGKSIKIPQDTYAVYAARALTEPAA